MLISTYTFSRDVALGLVLPHRGVGEGGKDGGSESETGQDGLRHGREIPHCQRHAVSAFSNQSAVIFL